MRKLKNTQNFDGTLHKIMKSIKFINVENITDLENEIQILKSMSILKSNSILEHIIRVVVQHMVKFAIIVEIRAILLNAALKRKAFIH